MVEVQEEPENMCMWSHGLKMALRPCKAKCRKVTEVAGVGWAELGATLQN